MLIDEKINDLQNLTERKITNNEIAKILGLGSGQAVINRINRKQELKEFEIIKLDNAFKNEINKTNQKLTTNNNVYQFPTGDRIEISYWSELPEELKNPKIVSVWFDREIIENAWGMSAEHLCIVPMVGDKMARYWYPIRPNDILIVDTSQDYIMGNGVYFATSRDNSRFWIREMQVLINNDIEFKGFSPSGNTTKVINSEQLKEAGFRIIGKVIKNVSFRL
jgi:phage repressor protein C with HTH and peptisase S24 domain